MLPAKPPLPVPLKRLFQPDWGIQISTRMSESRLGFKVAVTRQKDGRSGNGFPVVGTNLPAATNSALVMVVCGNCRAARPSQLAKAGTWKRASPASARRSRRNRVGPSAAFRFGRDDNGRGSLCNWVRGCMRSFPKKEREKRYK